VSIMSMPTPPLGIWSIWKELSPLQQLIFGVLVVVSMYSFFSAVRVLLRLRSIRELPGGDRSVIRQSLASLSNRCTNLQQLITSMFYLFGIVLFIALQRVGVFVGDGNFSPASVILGQFIVDCAFASNVFAVLLVLQLLQWFASSRVNSSLEAFSGLS
jgi:hypothetical protein